MIKNKKDGGAKAPNLEDITELKEVAEKITHHINQFEKIIESRVDKLEEEVKDLKNN